MVRTDEELMRAHRDGDAAAFKELFARYGAPLTRAFRAHGIDEEASRDLVQQTFLHLHRARNDFRAEAKLRPWLYTIALNLRRQHYRRRARKPENLPGELPEQTARENGVSRADLRRDLDRALATLPEGQRDVVVLHWFGDLSFAEVADVVGASVSAVKVRAHRAYSALRTVLEACNQP